MNTKTYYVSVFAVQKGTMDGMHIIDREYDCDSSWSYSRCREYICSQLRALGLLCDFFIVIDVKPF